MSEDLNAENQKWGWRFRSEDTPLIQSSEQDFIAICDTYHPKIEEMEGEEITIVTWEVDDA